MHLFRHGGKVACAATALLALLTVNCCTNSYGAQPDPSHPAANPAVLAVGFVFIDGLLQPMLPFLLILLACAQLPGPSAALRKVLTCTPLKRVADVSYDVYLLHPIVILCVWSVLPPSVWFDPAGAWPFLGVAALVLALSLGAAVLHGWVVSAVCGMTWDKIAQLAHHNKAKKA